MKCAARGANRLKRCAAVLGDEDEIFRRDDPRVEHRQASPRIIDA